MLFETSLEDSTVTLQSKKVFTRKPSLWKLTDEFCQIQPRDWHSSCQVVHLNSSNAKSLGPWGIQKQSFKPKYLHKQNSKIPSNSFKINPIPYLFFPPTLESWQTWLQNFPGDSTCGAPASLKHSSHMPKTLCMNTSFYAITEYAASQDCDAKQNSLCNYSLQERKGAGEIRRN